MTRTRTCTTLTILLCLLTAALAGTMSPAAAQDDDAKLIAVAPPVGQALSYDIPLKPWSIPEMLELKTRFDEGFSSEFTAMAETQTEADLTTLVDAGRELAVSSAKVNDSIRAIGELDVTYGIEGISRIIPAESALRDTLFGFVVWHEFSSAPAKGMMTRFEDLADRVVSAGPVAGDLAEELASAQTRLADAVASADAPATAHLTPKLIETAGRIDAVCTSAAVDAGHLMAIVDSLGSNSGEGLAEKWGVALESTRTVGAPATRTGAALREASGILNLVVELGKLVDKSTESVAAMSAAPSADGNIYVPWTLLRNDYELVGGLEHIFFGMHDHGADLLDADHQCVDGGHEVDETMAARIAVLLPLHVEANDLLAERAVEHASATVGFATDAIEEFYMTRERYSDDLDQEQKARVFAAIDKRFRENMDYGVARVWMRAARAELMTARAERLLGDGHESQALFHYHNVWLHCLNAGAAAGRAQDAAFNQ